MAALHPDASWWLKVERAEQHLADIKSILGPVLEPGLGRVRVEKKPKGDEWIYSVHYDFEPPRSLRPMIGDFMFNLRSALDHIAAANPANPVTSRRLDGKFPIFTQDPRIVDPQNPQAHVRWLNGWNKVKKATDPKVWAVMEHCQPFTQSRLNSTEAENDALGIFNNLQNADKHTSLSIISLGIRDFVSVAHRSSGEIVTFPGPLMPIDTMLPNGADVFTHPEPMDVELQATIVVALSGGLETRYRPIPDTFDAMLESVQAILTLVEREM